jgi:SAM-dependent methyltransferase
MKDILEELATESNFDERAYLSANPDVAQAVKNGSFKSGRAHFNIFGKREGRRLFKSRFSGRKEASAADYWDKNVKVHNGKQRVSWLDSQIIIESLVRKDSKGNHVNVPQWLKWVKERYADTPFREGLSIGCGDGTLERHALQLEICKTMDGIDLSKRSVEISRNTAKKEGLRDKITYSLADMNGHFFRKINMILSFAGWRYITY